MRLFGVVVLSEIQQFKLPGLHQFWHREQRRDFDLFPPGSALVQSNDGMSAKPMMKRLFWIVLLTSASLLTPVAPAQTFDATKIGNSLPLTGNLRMQTGDDLGWADPGYDDSQWKLVAAIRR